MSTVTIKPRIVLTFLLTATCLLLLAVGSSGARAAEFGISSFDGEVANQDGSAASQAGGRPWEAYGIARFNVGDRPDPLLGSYLPAETVRDLVIDLPPGFVGNPRGVPQCSSWEIYGTPSFLIDPKLNQANCQIASQIGALGINGPIGSRPPFGSSPENPWGLPAWFGLFNMVPPPGKLAAFGANFVGIPAVLTAELDPYDYSVRIVGENINQGAAFTISGLNVWGVPADPSHDLLRVGYKGTERVQSLVQGGGQIRPEPLPTAEPISAGVERTAFLRNPTSCTPAGVGVETKLLVRSWGGKQAQASFFSHQPAPNQAEQIGPTGCNALDFSPTVDIKPTTNLAEAPTGLDFHLHLPQNEDPDALATADLRDAVVKLPPGMTVNPSSAAGLDACTPAQIGLVTPVGEADAHFNGAPAACPDASKLGTATVTSPAVDHPLGGTVYLASQDQNPFGSLLALYIAIEDPRTGVIVKLPGEVKADSQTGQLTASFRKNPQLPVEDLQVNFFGGPRAALKTPAACGSHQIAAQLTPWSSPEGADANRVSSFALNRGPDGGACLSTDGQAPLGASFNAGTLDPTAAAYTPFLMRIARADGSQQIKAIEMTLPPGLVARLSGTPYCSDAALAAAAGREGRAEQASSSCPADSQVGTVEVGAGVGSTPLYVPGKAYLAGPYKGAPLSLAIVTPAVAGPFDLGTVVVRAALQVNPETARVRAVSDPIPHILQGIPLSVRSVTLRADKPRFMLNPTSCDPMAVSGTLTSVFDRSGALNNPFQVGDCGELGFKPKLSLKLKGANKRGGYPALRAVLTAPEGQANLARVSVALPRSAFLAQEHIRTICTRVQFAANACPEASVYGRARAFTPLLDRPLEGNVYLRSSSNPLPDLVMALRGQIDVDVVGRIDSFKGGIRNTFETVPDAPVTRFELEMRGGKRGLLVNSRDICKSVSRAKVLIDAQNGKTADQTPVVKPDCKRKGGGKGKKGKRGAHRHKQQKKG